MINHIYFCDGCGDQIDLFGSRSEALFIYPNDRVDKKDFCGECWQDMVKYIESVHSDEPQSVPGESLAACGNNESVI